MESCWWEGDRPSLPRRRGHDPIQAFRNRRFALLLDAISGRAIAEAVIDFACEVLVARGDEIDRTSRPVRVMETGMLVRAVPGEAENHRVVLTAPVNPSHRLDQVDAGLIAHRLRYDVLVGASADRCRMMRLREVSLREISGMLRTHCFSGSPRRRRRRAVKLATRL